MPNQYGSTDDEIKAKVAKARSLGYWFYCKRSGKWMSPTEFETHYDYCKIINGGNSDWLKDYYAADPKGGIEHKLTDVKKAIADLEKFTKLVLDNNHLREKDKP